MKNIFCNISLYTATIDQYVVAGLVIYKCRQTIHVQYIASNEIGKEVGAIDAIVHYLIDKIFGEYEWFDFGISTLPKTGGFSIKVYHQKELFGARTISYQQFSILL